MSVILGKGGMAAYRPERTITFLGDRVRSGHQESFVGQTYRAAQSWKASVEISLATVPNDLKERHSGSYAGYLLAIHFNQLTP